jgi:hypothetical protein
LREFHQNRHCVSAIAVSKQVGSRSSMKRIFVSRFTNLPCASYLETGKRFGSKKGTN